MRSIEISPTLWAPVVERLLLPLIAAPPWRAPAPFACAHMYVPPLLVCSRNFFLRHCSLINDVVNAGDGFAISSPYDFYQWLQTSFIPYVLSDTDDSGAALPPEQCGYLGQYGLIVGGVRLVQFRAIPETCASVSPGLAAVYGKTCPKPGSYSTDPFGDLPLAQSLGVESAFLPSAPQTGSDSNTGAEFEWYFNVENSTQWSLDTVTSLASGEEGIHRTRRGERERLRI